MKLENKKILVTGADGFIGSHLVEYLITRGCSVRAFVYYNSFNSWGWLEESPADIKKSVEIFMGDIRDPYGVRKAVQGCDIVFHLAALIGIPYSYHSPDNYVDTNIKGTLNILQASRDFAVQKVILTSTSEVYGTAQFVPITETHPLHAQSPYAATKIAADQLAMSFHDSFGLPVAIARPFNTYGPRQSARAIIPAIITQLSEGETSIKLGALTPTRDLNYIADTVRGFAAIAEAEGSIGEVINLGSGYEISIGDLAKLIMELSGRQAEIKCDEERLRPDKSEVERLCADNAKALRVTGWKPEYGGAEGLKRGLLETIEWFSDPQNLSRYKAWLCNL